MLAFPCLHFSLFLTSLCVISNSTVKLELHTYLKTNNFVLLVTYFYNFKVPLAPPFRSFYLWTGHGSKAKDIQLLVVHIKLMYFIFEPYTF
jgi:hypothetical protein